MLTILALEMGQDDPAKCTAKKMIRLDLARTVSRKFHASDNTIVLNPYSERAVSVDDKNSKAILVVDCSWKQAREVFFRTVGGKHRRLPALLAANPTNYSKLGMLSSVEAVAAAAYIVGDSEFATELLSIYKWGSTFETLNKEPLKAYSEASSEAEIFKLEAEFFPQLSTERP